MSTKQLTDTWPWRTSVDVDLAVTLDGTDVEDASIEYKISTLDGEVLHSETLSSPYEHVVPALSVAPGSEILRSIVVKIDGEDSRGREDRFTVDREL